MADNADLSKNPYDVLGISPGGPDVTDAEIKKAYRIKALKLHPDKRPAADREVAEKEFNELQRYYEMLCDPEARKAFDNLEVVRRARRERDSALDDRRKRMKQDLEEREKAFDSRRNDEAMAKAKLKAEIERLRRSAAERERQQAADRRAAASAAGGAGPSSAAPSSWADFSEGEGKGRTPVPADGPDGAAQTAAAAASEQLRRTLKLAWDRRDGDYGAPRLREIFSAFGPVEDVVLRESSKKAKGSALVVMATGDGARRAASSQVGDIANPILVLPASKAGLPDEDAEDAPRAAGAGAGPSTSAAAGGGGAPAFGARVPHSASAPFLGGFTAPLFPGGAKPAGGLGGAFQAMGATGAVGKDYENVTLHRMRQQAERARLIAEMEKKEAEEQEAAAGA